MDNMERAIITGPTGSIGIALINKLIDEGIKVIAVVRPGSKRADRIPESDMVTKVECDLCNLDKLSDIIDGKADVFYHFGWDGTFGVPTKVIEHLAIAVIICMDKT